MVEFYSIPTFIHIHGPKIKKYDVNNLVRNFFWSVRFENEIYIYYIWCICCMNKWEINLSKKLISHMITLINLYIDFWYMQCPPIIEENNWKSIFNITGFCDLPWIFSECEVYILCSNVRIHFQDLHLIIPF